MVVKYIDHGGSNGRYLTFTDDDVCLFVFFFQGSITAAIWMHKITRFCAQWPQALRRLGMIMSPSIARQLGVLCLALQDLSPGRRRGAQLVNMDGRMDGT